MRRVKEKKAEQATNKWYDSVYPNSRRKLNGEGRRGWPDQEYFIEGGKPVLIEFKAEGEEPEALQGYIHEQLLLKGYNVQTHTRAEDAITAIKAAIREATPKRRRPNQA